MTLEAFAKQVSLFGMNEVEKVRHLAYFHHKLAGTTEFSIEDVKLWFAQLNLAQPNASRLRRKLTSSRSFIRGATAGTYRLHATDLDEMQATFPGIRAQSEEVVSNEALLPRSLYEGTRGFVEALARQINASYEYNIFDGCAVLMRRLVEVLLILSYEHHNIENDILDADANYIPLERIVAHAKGSRVLKLSRNSKTFMDDLRTLGNFAAHKIYFTTRRSDIEIHATEFRAIVEELLYKSGIRK